MVCVRTLTLAMRRCSEVSDGLRSPEQAIPELEISWVSEEREELDKKRSTGRSWKGSLSPLLPETHWSQWIERISKPFLSFTVLFITVKS
jgi:hypothetical protein